MNTELLTMNALFEQLGLEPSDVAIQKFLHSHTPLPKNITLHKAIFWNQSQAEFLQQAIAQDSEWSYLVDDLDARLRKTV